MSARGVLLKVLPAARNVLELGVRDVELSIAYRQHHSGSIWTALPDGAAIPGSDYDLVVLNDALSSMSDPFGALTELPGRLTPDAKLICAVANGAHAQIIGQLLLGDPTPRLGGIMDPQRPRLVSCSSAYKLLLDAGWLPQLLTVMQPPQSDDPVTRALVEAARLLGVPETTSRRMLSDALYVIEAQPWAERDLPRGKAKISVVVAVNRPLQHHINVDVSPGLAEIAAEIVPVVNAKTAAEALEQGRARSNGDWIVFCHQDVYFPAGTGAAITREADRLEAAGHRDALFGFAGLSRAADGSPVHAGMVIDRINRFDHPATDAAISLDELAVAMHRDCPLRIDPALGWHLWATDLAMQARRRTPPIPVHAVRTPVFHNSLSDWSLPKDFSASAAVLRAKYPDAGRIDSLCVQIP